MALNKITYDNKVSLNPQPSIANVNKCTDSDLNEIKSVVNSAIDFCNEIIESGSNARGNYIKYIDGTMVCWYRQWFGEIAINTADGALYRSDNLSLQDFPQEFVGIPIISKVITGNNWSLACIGSPSGSSATTTNPGNFNLYKTTSTGTGVVAFAINIIAIGRWKA